MGLEPTNGGTTNHCLNHLATPAMSVSIYYYSTIVTIYISQSQIRKLQFDRGYFGSCDDGITIFAIILL